MKHSPRSPKTLNLSESISRHLDMYALAASAAGVGVIALAQPAEGKIVFTPADVPIVGTVNIDLNHDGLADFAIKQNLYAGSYMAAHSLTKNRVWGAGRRASALPAGVRVGPNAAKFGEAPVCSFLSVTSGPCKSMLQCRNFSGSTFCRGPFADITTAFLGLKFYIKGEIHFGWARFKFSNPELVLTGYAYETVPKKPIITGKKRETDDNVVGKTDPASLSAPAVSAASLGLLAMGAPGSSFGAGRVEACEISTESALPTLSRGVNLSCGNACAHARRAVRWLRGSPPGQPAPGIASLRLVAAGRQHSGDRKCARVACALPV